MPFTHGYGECDACRAGFDGTCDNHPGYTNWSSGFQSEYVHFHYANWALIKIPGQPSDYSEGMMKSLLTLADVMPTGYHAARVADVKRGDKVVVIGDGAVGQCARYCGENARSFSDCLDEPTRRPSTNGACFRSYCCRC